MYPGLSAPSKVEEIWRAEFDYMVRKVPGGVFTLTMHPQVIGRGHRMLMLERLLNYMQSEVDVVFSACHAAVTGFSALQDISVKNQQHPNQPTTP